MNFSGKAIILKDESDKKASAEKPELMLMASLFSMLEGSLYLRKKTTGTYRTSLNKFALALGDDALGPGMIYFIRDKYLKQGNNPVTANNSIDNVAWMYRKFSKRHDIEYDPFKGFERLPQTQMSTRNLAFTKEDQAVLEKYMIENNYPLYLFTRYMYFAFIRPRELRFLKVKHVQISSKSIVIPVQISKNRKTETVVIIPLPL